MRTAILSYAHDLDGYPTYFDSEAERNECLRQGVGKRNGNDRFDRLEASNHYDAYSLSDGKFVPVEDTYVEPLPHAALTYELYMHLKSPDEWLERTREFSPGMQNLFDEDLYIPCNSHAERVLLAEYFSNQGFIDLDGARHRITSIGYHDRIIVHDKLFTFRRSRMGTLDKAQRAFGKQLRPLIETLNNLKEKGLALIASQEYTLQRPRNARKQLTYW
jgi:hypothetical protein